MLRTKSIDKSTSYSMVTHFNQQLLLSKNMKSYVCKAAIRPNVSLLSEIHTLRNSQVAQFMRKQRSKNSKRGSAAGTDQDCAVVVSQAHAALLRSGTASYCFTTFRPEKPRDSIDLTRAFLKSDFIAIFLWAKILILKSH